MDQSYQSIESGDLVLFHYVNAKGKEEEHKGIIKGFFFGKTMVHREYQLFVNVFDLNKLEHREFATRNISGLLVVEM